MLRLTEIKLPLDHPESALHEAILKRLSIDAPELVEFSIFRRGVDARKPHAILLIYTVDLELRNEAQLLKRFAKDPHVKPTPDTSYKFVTAARQVTDKFPRPVIVGFGPAGLIAALILA